jgi:DNA polymerase-3 subunit delta'
VVFGAGNHPDYHVVYRQLVRLEKTEAKAKELSIDVIRAYLVDPANRKPSMGHGKVFVVEEAESMNASAQNAMLKTLEEPFGRALIVLLTDQPESLLLTIRSRCQLVRFSALEEGRVRQELEKRGISPTDAADAASFGEGSLGRAIGWLEDGVIVHARELRQRLEGMLSGRPMVDLPEWFKKTVDEYAVKQLARDELASKDQMTREGMGLYLRLAAQVLRRHLSGAQQSAGLDGVCGGIEAMVRADQYLDANVNIALIFQQLAVTLERLFAA